MEEIKLDYTNMMAEVVGEQGIRDEELAALEGRIGQIHDELTSRRTQGELPVYDLPFDRDQLATTRTLGNELAERFDNVVVLGIGGSALGTTAVARALGGLHHNLAAPERRPRLFVLDNVDPVGVAETLDLLAPTKTVFLVISKSGSTVETMSQFAVAQQWVRQQGAENWKDHFVLITDPASGTLRKLAEEEDFRSCPIPAGVGGRFTVFTPVGLLPLAAVGVDVEALLEGAAGMAERVTRGGLFDNPAYLNAALQYLAYGKGQTISVLMPYSDRLRDVADWYRQLWAESLGKKFARSGEIVHVGPTPVRALGTTDQHSQVQLYMEGPVDKVVTFLAPEDYGRQVKIPSFAEAPDLQYLAGHSLNELIAYERQATALALTKNGRPNCTLTMPTVSARTVGALLYMLEIQTLCMGGLLNVNPLDQPGVEEGKQFTYALMGRAGFAEKKSEFAAALDGMKRRIL